MHHTHLSASEVCVVWLFFTAIGDSFLWNFRSEEWICTALIGAQFERMHVHKLLWLYWHRKLSPSITLHDEYQQVLGGFFVTVTIFMLLFTSTYMRICYWNGHHTNISMTMSNEKLNFSKGRNGKVDRQVLKLGFHYLFVKPGAWIFALCDEHLPLQRAMKPLCWCMFITSAF